MWIFCLYEIQRVDDDEAEEDLTKDKYSPDRVLGNRVVEFRTREYFDFYEYL